VSSRLHALATAAPAADAVLEPGRAYTRAELERRTAAFARRLAAAGVTPGARLAWMMRNRVEVLVLGLAAQRVGAVTVPLGHRATRSELARMLAAARPAAIVADAAARDALAGLVAVTVLDVDSPGPEVDSAGTEPEAAAGPPEDSRRLGAGASMVFTSGTTGRPKAALRSRGDPRLGAAIADAFGLDSGTRFLAAGPLYHSGPWTCALMALDRGGLVAVLPGFDAVRWLTFTAEHGLTAAFVTPTQLRRLVDAVVAGCPAPRTLRHVIVSGECFPADLKHRAVAALGPCLLDCYGCTELGPLTLQPADRLLERPDSCGRPFPGVEIAAFDGAARLPAGRSGLLRVRTPLAFDGYLDAGTGRPDGAGQGWATVGDIGHVDANGYVHLTGRADDLIISGGVNIHPAEVEAVLAEHPAVRRCAVLGVPDPDWGEVVCAVVVAPAALTLDELRRWLRGRLADDRRPRRLVRVDELPTTATDKVSRRALRALVSAPAGPASR
jgi:acyl-CoA synthetase (AMP-forming)/AMP-acid ligase II